MLCLWKMYSHIGIEKNNNSVLLNLLYSVSSFWVMVRGSLYSLYAHVLVVKNSAAFMRCHLEIIMSALGPPQVTKILSSAKAKYVCTHYCRAYRTTNLNELIYCSAGVKKKSSVELCSSVHTRNIHSYVTYFLLKGHQIFKYYSIFYYLITIIDIRSSSWSKMMFVNRKWFTRPQLLPH